MSSQVSYGSDPPPPHLGKIKLIVHMMCLNMLEEYLDKLKVWSLEFN